MNSREAFEQWVRDRGLDAYYLKEAGFYYDDGVDLACNAWDAACQYKDEHYEAVLKRQAGAARMGMDAATKTSRAELQAAQRLAAESSPEALESEREANERLTVEIKRLEARIAELEAQPTHQCRGCGALWRQNDDNWQLVSRKAGACCDNAPMGDQIEPLNIEDYLKPGESALECIRRNRRDAVQALKMLAEALRVPEWQPIETAPKDGTAFVGTDGKYAYRTKRGAYYEKFPHHEGGPTYSYKWNKEDDHSVCPWRPTHWMPLPAPPAPAGEE